MFTHMLVLLIAVRLGEVQAVGETEIVIKGGTLVTAYGVREADIWIQEGKIAQIAKGQMNSKKQGKSTGQAEIFDASRYYVLPGFIYMGSFQLNRLRNVSAYLREIRNLVELGCTSMLDTVRMEEWMGVEQLLYHLTPHYNNLIDYAMQIGLEARQFAPPLLRMLGRRGMRLIQVAIREPHQINSVQWDMLHTIIHQYHLSVQLSIPKEQAISEEQRQEIATAWLDRCQYWRIRTRIEQLGPLLPTQKESFYHVAMLGPGHCDRWFHHLLHNWYDPFPAISSIEKVTIRHPELRKKPTELLSLLVRLSSTNIAKALGIYPRKGCLQQGADADFLFIEKSAWLTNFDLSTILNCSEICLPTYVMSNGKWIYRDGVHSPLVGTGSYLQELKPYSHVM